jgi:hypothetical protein
VIKINDTEKLSLETKSLIIRMKMLYREIRLGCQNDVERLKLLGLDFNDFIDSIKDDEDLMKDRERLKKLWK